MQNSTADSSITYDTKLDKTRQIDYKTSYVLDNDGDVKNKDGGVIASNNCFIHNNFDKSWKQYIGKIYDIISNLREQTLKQAAASAVSDMVLDNNVLLNKFLSMTNLRVVLYSVSITHLRNPSYPLLPRYIGCIGNG